MWQQHTPRHVQQYMQQNPYRLLALSFLVSYDGGNSSSYVAYSQCRRARYGLS